VYAVDVAPSMARHAREALGDRATVLCQDLTELALPEPVDVVFSNATFHWIPDHDALFAALHRNMKPGARLLAQCGGRGNIDSFRRSADQVAAEQPFVPYFAEWRRPWNYAAAEETAAGLRRAGFAQVSCWLQAKPTPIAEARSFVRAVCLVRQLDPLPEPLREQFIGRVLEREGEPLVLAYVRLNIAATRV
jgi:trans-aconitate 2-methyltransferase